MTSMRRVTIALPDSLDEKIVELRKTDDYARCSYSEIVRRVLERGLALDIQTNSEPTERQAG